MDAKVFEKHSCDFDYITDFQFRNMKTWNLEEAAEKDPRGKDSIPATEDRLADHEKVTLNSFGRAAAIRLIQNYFSDYVYFDGSFWTQHIPEPMFGIVPEYPASYQCPKYCAYFAARFSNVPNYALSRFAGQFRLDADLNEVQAIYHHKAALHSEAPNLFEETPMNNGDISRLDEIRNGFELSPAISSYLHLTYNDFSEDADCKKYKFNPSSLLFEYTYDGSGSGRTENHPSGTEILFYSASGSQPCDHLYKWRFPDTADENTILGLFFRDNPTISYRCILSVNGRQPQPNA